MKKFALVLLCSFLFTLAGSAQVVITEIMYNPPESGVDSLEYIELYNNSNTAVNLENWSMVGVTLVFPAATTLNSHQYIVTGVNAAALQHQLGITALQWTGGALTNSGETLAVLNPAGDTIDKVAYTNLAPWPIAAAGNGPSLVLCDPNADNSLPTSWQAAATPTGVIINGKEIFANPGAPSGCPNGVTAFADQFVAPSGQTTNFNVLANDNLPGQGPVVTITVAPQHGTATVNPDNTIAYTPNSNYCGSDALTYKVCEGTDCAEALVNITVRCYPKYTIDQINNLNADGAADSLGIYCELTANTYGVNLRGSTVGLQFTMIDDSNNGITVFSATSNFGYTVKEKDKITVRGSINQFNGLIQIFPDTLFKVSANNPLVTPQDVVTHSENTESKLIRIKNLHYVDPAQWTTGAGTGFSVFMISDDHPNDTIQVRIDNDVDLFNEPAPAVPFDLTGIGGQFDSSTPFSSGYQIAPRYKPDVSTLVGTKTADFSANVRLTPNPVSDHLLLQTDLDFDGLQIFSATGQLVHSVAQPEHEMQIGVRDLAAGVYFVRFQKDTATWTTRFVKQ